MKKRAGIRKGKAIGEAILNLLRCQLPLKCIIHAGAFRAVLVCTEATLVFGVRGVVGDLQHNAGHSVKNTRKRDDRTTSVSVVSTEAGGKRARHRGGIKSCFR